MKKALFILVTIFCLFSCVQNRFPAQEDNSTPLEKFLTGYHKNHPDWLINDVVAQRTNDSLMVVFESMADTIFDGYPLRVEIVRQFTDSTYCVNLRAWQKPNSFHLKDEIEEIGGDIIAFVSEEQAMKIIEKEFYTFKGKFIKRTNHDFYQTTTGMRMHYTDGYGVRKNDTWKDKYDFGFGILVYAVDSLKPYK